MQEIQSRRAIEGPESNREREEMKKLRTLVTDSRKDITAMRQRVKISRMIGMSRMILF